MRILCLDIGEKRIGVAVSDPLCLTAQGLKVIERRGDKKDFPAIEELCRELSVELILVGLPLDEEGGEGKAAGKTRKFSERLALHLKNSGVKIPFEFWDESYSTEVAENFLIDADVGRKKRRLVIDKMAAVVILTDYLAGKE